MPFAIKFIVLVSLVAFYGPFSRPIFALDLREKIDPLAKPLVEDGQVVGFVVGIVRNGETQILAYGETAKGSGEKPTGKTIYEIGSITKAVTGVLLADMVR